MDLIQRLNHFEQGGTVENPKALLREAIAEIERLRKQAPCQLYHGPQPFDWASAANHGT